MMSTTRLAVEADRRKGRATIRKVSRRIEGEGAAVRVALQHCDGDTWTCLAVPKVVHTDPANGLLAVFLPVLVAV